MSNITRSVAGASLGLTNRQETIAARGLIASTTSGTTAQVLYCDYIGASSIRKLDI